LHREETIYLPASCLAQKAQAQIVFLEQMLHQAARRRSYETFSTTTVPGVTNIEWTINNRVRKRILQVIPDVSLSALNGPVTAVRSKLEMSPQFFDFSCLEFSDDPIDLLRAELDANTISLGFNGVA
jgi:hypothetical protein